MGSSSSGPLPRAAHKATFDDLRLDRTTISDGDFEECQFRNCSFQEAEFDACRLMTSSFVGCNLSLARFPRTRLATVQFKRSKLVGINWTVARWPQLGLGQALNFNDCVLSQSVFIGLALKGVSFKDCIAHEVDFSDSNLAKCDFSGTDLSGARFNHTDLSGADFRSARNYTIDPMANTLKGAQFSLPEAVALLTALGVVIVDE
ncbi:MAG: pentapeptide repeat-containing protein [Candidatus Dormibacteraeota bacterium]|nr:pentapeptide repeat-containing protein [Candidatus Dormibacteraeota bacterium]